MHEGSQRRFAPDLDVSAATPEQQATPLSVRRERSERAWSALRRRTDVRNGAAFVVFALVAVIALTAGWLRPAIYHHEPSASPGVRCDLRDSGHASFDFCTVVAMDANGANLPGLSARNARLPLLRAAGATLRGAEFAYADLSGADLAGADLRAARLVGARLASADLRHADLRGADLRYAELLGARFAGARLQGARFDAAIAPDGSVCTSAACIGRP